MISLTDANLLDLIATRDADKIAELFAEARKIREQHYGRRVYFRGLIEFTNYCKNDCYYCGIRRSNARVERYRLSCAEILDCCRQGNQLGYRTFVLQGGEDPWWNDDRLCAMIAAVRNEFPEHAITVSLGERNRKSYERIFQAGANRYLLRHETADAEHYAKLHPTKMNLAARKKCLEELKAIGFQVGAGFMVGAPYQTSENLLADLRFLETLQPQMVGIGPFIPQKDTPFGEMPQGTLEATLTMVALSRLLLPKALIPATTALGTIAANGRELALDAGANVVMPNLSPVKTRKLYALYDNKICLNDGAEHCRHCLGNRIRLSGYEPDFSRGDAVR